MLLTRFSKTMHALQLVAAKSETKFNQPMLHNLRLIGVRECVTVLSIQELMTGVPVSTAS